LAAEDIPVPYNQALETAMIPSVERIKKYILKLVNNR
jgi:pyruvate dehydrogenase E1 component beta subunit